MNLIHLMSSDIIWIFCRRIERAIVEDRPLRTPKFGALQWDHFSTCVSRTEFVWIQVNSSLNENFSSSSQTNCYFRPVSSETSLMIKLWFIKQTKFILQILVYKQTNSDLVCVNEVLIVQIKMTIKAGAQSERALTWNAPVIRPFFHRSYEC